MNEIRIADTDLAELRSKLVGYKVEHCAVMLAAQAAAAENSSCLVVREVHFPNVDDYLSQSDTFAQLTPEFVAKITKMARNSKLQLIFVHSHLAPLPPTFSHIDDQGEQVLAKFLSTRGLVNAHAAMVLSPGGITARKLGSFEKMAVISIGHRRIVEYCPSAANDASVEQYDRQIRAFGLAGQHAIQGLRIAIVGLGGTGSVLAQQLVHLGVREFLLLDPDTLERTNLNRVVGARDSDIGAPKVQIAQRYIEDFSNKVSVQTIIGDVCRAQIAKELASADFIFGCTDSHGSRSVIQQIAYQYLIPCIDMGSTITAPQGEVTGIYGRIQLLSPGHGCLWCSGLLNPEEIRRDMLSERERKMDPYIPGSREPAPSVISLNSTVVSMAVSMFLNVVTEIPGDARHLVYDARAPKLRSVVVKSNSDCFICSTQGVLARGNGQPLFARQD